jgi:hypothetical protein
MTSLMKILVPASVAVGIPIEQPAHTIADGMSITRPVTGASAQETDE